MTMFESNVMQTTNYERAYYKCMGRKTFGTRHVLLFSRLIAFDHVRSWMFHYHYSIIHKWITYFLSLWCIHFETDNRKFQRFVRVSLENRIKINSIDFHCCCQSTIFWYSFSNTFNVLLKIIPYSLNSHLDGFVRENCSIYQNGSNCIYTWFISK